MFYPVPKTQNFNKRHPIKTAIPIVRQLMEIVDATKTIIRGHPMQDRIYAWRCGKSGPQLQAFQELAIMYHYEVMLVPRAHVAAVQAMLATPQPARHTHGGAAGGPGIAARTAPSAHGPAA